MIYDATKVAFIDTETTGLDPDLDRIWKIAVIVFTRAAGWQEHCWQVELPIRYVGFNGDKNTIGGFSPTGWASDWVKTNTALLAEYDHDSALTEDQTARRLIQLTEGRHLIGAVPSFDDRRLHNLLRRVAPIRWATSTPWHYRTIDAETLMLGWIARGQFLGLDTVYDLPMPWDPRELSRQLGIDPDEFGPAHDALNDARWARACWEAVMGRASWGDDDA